MMRLFLLSLLIPFSLNAMDQSSSKNLYVGLVTTIINRLYRKIDGKQQIDYHPSARHVTVYSISEDELQNKSPYFYYVKQYDEIRSYDELSKKTIRYEPDKRSVSIKKISIEHHNETYNARVSYHVNNNEYYRSSYIPLGYVCKDNSDYSIERMNTGEQSAYFNTTGEFLPGSSFDTFPEDVRVLETTTPNSELLDHPHNVPIITFAFLKMKQIEDDETGVRYEPMPTKHLTPPSDKNHTE